jgi:hypothetical protein
MGLHTAYLVTKELKGYWSTGGMVLNLETLRKVEHKYPESFKMWCCRRMEKISWTDRMRNEEVLHSQGGEEYHTYSKKEEG